MTHKIEPLQNIIDEIAAITRETPQAERIRCFKKMIRTCTSYDFNVGNDHDTAVRGLQLMVGKMVYRDTGENDATYCRIFADGFQKKRIKKEMEKAVRQAWDNFVNVSAAAKKLPSFSVNSQKTQKKNVCAL